MEIIFLEKGKHKKGVMLYLNIAPPSSPNEGRPPPSPIQSALTQPAAAFLKEKVVSDVGPCADTLQKTLPHSIPPSLYQSPPAVSIPIEAA